MFFVCFCNFFCLWDSDSAFFIIIIIKKYLNHEIYLIVPLKIIKVKKVYKERRQSLYCLPTVSFLQHNHKASFYVFLLKLQNLFLLKSFLFKIQKLNWDKLIDQFFSRYWFISVRFLKKICYNLKIYISSILKGRIATKRKYPYIILLKSSRKIS